MYTGCELIPTDQMSSLVGGQDSITEFDWYLFRGYKQPQNFQRKYRTDVDSLMVLSESQYRRLLAKTIEELAERTTR